MNSKLDLKNVTLWGCVWSSDENMIDRTFRVMRHCTRQADFGEVVFFCSKSPNISPGCGWRVVSIPRLSMAGWNVFVNREVPKHIKTDFALSVHEDGFIIEPKLWRPEFLQCDYIGAPWPDRVVGNQGFCIESKKLLQQKASLPANDGSIASDTFICRTHRNRLEKQGVRFASTQLAEVFATEMYGDDHPSFGFHGRQHCKRKYPLGWQKVRQSEQVQSVALVYPYPMNPLSCNRAEFDACARRFAATYLSYSPEADHTLYVVCSNGPRDKVCEDIFQRIPAVFDRYDGGGWDIGCEQFMARKLKEDFVISMTSRTYFHRRGWLKRFIEARNQFGEGLYGTTGSYEVSPHIRTAFYGVDSWIYRDYPHLIDSRPKGFWFESEQWSFTKYVQGMGYPCLMVTWDGCYQLTAWRKPPNIFRSGDQTNLLAFDRHSLIYQQADATTKRTLKDYADGTVKR